MSESDNNLERKLMSMLSDPTAMAGIMNLVKSLGVKGSDPPKETFSSTNVTSNEAVPAGAFEQIAQSENKSLEVPALPAFGNINHHDEFSSKSLGLLLAIKPFLSRDRAQKLETVTQILKVISLTDLFK
ncbi:MAG: hypothetical protein IJ391_03760 [Clostridia bacterium]|nr:hypothetical protein [Clostridia bacterium]